MARKSSFLMGFETGSEMWSKATRDAAMRAQVLDAQKDRAMKAKMDKTREERLRQEIDWKNKQLNLEQSNRDDALSATQQARMELEDVDLGSAEGMGIYFDKIKVNYYPSISKDPGSKRRWDAWESALLSSTAGKQWEAFSDAKNAASVASVQFGIEQQKKRLGLIAEANQLTNNTFDPLNPDHIVTSRALVASHKNAAEAATALGGTPADVFDKDYLRDKEGNYLFKPGVISSLKTKHKTAAYKHAQGIESDARALKRALAHHAARANQPNVAEFNDWAKGVDPSRGQMDYNNPQHQAEFLTYKHRIALQNEFSTHGVAGLALLGGLQSRAQGGYDPDDVALARAKLADMKRALTALGQGNRSMTEGERDALQLGSRMYRAQQVLTEMERSGYVGSTRWKADRAALKVNFNTMWGVSKEGQRYVTAQRSYITGTLRYNSGAAISESEFFKKDQESFPQLGADQAVIRQMSASRDGEIKTMVLPLQQNFSGLWAAAIGQQPAARTVPSATPTTPATTPTTPAPPTATPATSTNPRNPRTPAGRPTAFYVGTEAEVESQINEDLDRGIVNYGDQITIDTGSGAIIAILKQ